MKKKKINFLFLKKKKHFSGLFKKEKDVVCVRCL